MLETLQETRSTAQAIVARSGRELSLTKGKKHALKKYDQFALNKYYLAAFQNQILYHSSCAISRNFCYKFVQFGEIDLLKMSRGFS